MRRADVGFHSRKDPRYRGLQFHPVRLSSLPSQAYLNTSVLRGLFGLIVGLLVVSPPPHLSLISPNSLLPSLERPPSLHKRG
jgi:hypothetical protein